MITVANTLRRLAICTSLRQCAHRAQNSSIATLNRILKSPDRKLHCRRLTGVHHQQRKTALQNLSPKVQMLFNIHNPSQDHRDRGACAFLLTS
jgi:hypothetical protein